MDRRDFGKSVIASAIGAMFGVKAVAQEEMVSIAIQPYELARRMLVDGGVSFRLEDCRIVEVKKVTREDIQPDDIVWSSEEPFLSWEAIRVGNRRRE